MEAYGSQFDVTCELSCKAIDSLHRALKLIVEAAISGGGSPRASRSAAGTLSMCDIVNDLDALETTVDAVSIAAGQLRAQVKEDLSAVLKSLAESHTRMDKLRQDFVHVAGRAQSSSIVATSAAGFQSNRRSASNSGGSNFSVPRKLQAASISAREQMDRLKADNAALLSRSETLRATLKDLGNLRTTAARWRNWCRLAATRLQAHEVRRAEALQTAMSCFTKLTAALRTRAVSMTQGAIRALEGSNPGSPTAPSCSSFPSAETRRLLHRHLMEFQNVLSRFGQTNACSDDAVPTVPMLPSAFRSHGGLPSHHRTIDLVPALKELMRSSSGATVSSESPACQSEKAQGTHSDTDVDDALRRFLEHVSDATTINKDFVMQHLTTFRECLLDMMSPGVGGQSRDSTDNDVSTVSLVRSLLSILRREFISRDDSVSDFCTIAKSIEAAQNAVADAVHLLHCELPPAQSASQLLDVRVAAKTFGSQVCALLLPGRRDSDEGKQRKPSAPVDSALFHDIPTCFGNVAQRSLGLLLQAGNTAEDAPQLKEAFFAAADSLRTCEACISNLVAGPESKAALRKLSPTVRRVARASSRSRQSTNSVAVVRPSQPTNFSASSDASEWARLLQQPLDGLVQRFIELCSQRVHFSLSQNGARLRQKPVVGNKSMSRPSKHATEFAHREPPQTRERAVGSRNRRGKRSQRLLYDETEPTNNRSDSTGPIPEHAGRTKVAWEEI